MSLRARRLIFYLLGLISLLNGVTSAVNYENIDDTKLMTTHISKLLVAMIAKINSGSLKEKDKVLNKILMNSSSIALHTSYAVWKIDDLNKQTGGTEDNDNHIGNKCKVLIRYGYALISYFTFSPPQKSETVTLPMTLSWEIKADQASETIRCTAIMIS